MVLKLHLVETCDRVSERFGDGKGVRFRVNQCCQAIVKVVFSVVMNPVLSATVVVTV